MSKIQIYRMENIKLNMKLGQLQEQISKASLPISADSSNGLITQQTDQRNFLSFMNLFWENQKNIYNFIQVLLNIINEHTLFVTCIKIYSCL